MFLLIVRSGLLKSFCRCAASIRLFLLFFLFLERNLFLWRRIEVLFECIGRESLAHTGTVENAMGTVVDECCTVNSTLVGITIDTINAFFFEHPDKFVLVVSPFKCILQGFLGRLCQIPILDILLWECSLFLQCLIANGLAKQGWLEWIANLITIGINDRIDKTVIVLTSDIASNFFDSQVIERQ